MLNLEELKPHVLAASEIALESELTDFLRFTQELVGSLTQSLDCQFLKNEILTAIASSKPEEREDLIQLFSEAVRICVTMENHDM